jgi:hypothetical protein
MPTFFQEKISQQLGGSNREEEVTNEGGEIRGEMSFRPTKPKTRRTQNLPTRKPAGTEERKGRKNAKEARVEPEEFLVPNATANQSAEKKA